jgi:hypothetical protein
MFGSNVSMVDAPNLFEFFRKDFRASDAAL